MEISPNVIFRGDGGRFAAACTAAKTRAVQRCVNLGADRARFLAPEEYGELKTSIAGVMLSASEGVFVAAAKHALAQEFGAGEHLIGAPGQTLANLAKGFGPVKGPVSHPGNAAQPYLRPAYEIVKSRMIGIMREEYP